MTTTTNNPTMAPTCPGENIPTGNERPFSTSVEDLYHSLKGMHDAFSHFGEDLLEIIHANKHPASDALQVTFSALMGHYCALLKEVRFAAEIAKVRGWNRIANDAWLGKYDPEHKPAAK